MYLLGIFRHGDQQPPGGGRGVKELDILSQDALQVVLPPLPGDPGGYPGGHARRQVAKDESSDANIHEVQGAERGRIAGVMIGPGLLDPGTRGAAAILLS